MPDKKKEENSIEGKMRCLKIVLATNKLIQYNEFAIEN
jgi:hypothetical protein